MAKSKIGKQMAALMRDSKGKTLREETMEAIGMHQEMLSDSGHHSDRRKSKNLTKAHDKLMLGKKLGGKDRKRIASSIESYDEVHKDVTGEDSYAKRALSAKRGKRKADKKK